MSADTIVILNDRAEPVGGASLVAIESANGLAARGWKVHFIAGSGQARGDLHPAIRVHALDLPVLEGERSASLGSALAMMGSRAAAKALEAALAGLSPNTTIVHVHSWSKSLSPSIFGVLRKGGWPTVVTLHDFGFSCPNAAYHIFPVNEFCHLKPLSLSCLVTNCDSRRYAYKAWRTARQVNLRRLIGRSNFIKRLVCVSEYSKQVYEEMIWGDFRLQVVDNPIMVEQAAPFEPWNSRKYVYVGRLSREKGVATLARAARKAGVPITFVGEGPEEQKVRSLNPDAVITGWLSRDEVASEMAAARALILPAEWRETQGMVISEALARGLPCIAPFDTAPGSAIIDGVTGRRFPAGDANNLAAILADMLEDDLGVREMSSRAYQDYWKNPRTVGHHIHGLEVLYRDVATEVAKGKPIAGASTRTDPATV